MKTSEQFTYGMLLHNGSHFVNIALVDMISVKTELSKEISSDQKDV